MNLNSSFDLLNIRRRDAGLSRAPQRRPGRDTTTPGPAWSNKDTAGNSSIAQRNQRIKDEQIRDKAKEAYLSEKREEITEDLQDFYQGDTGKTPLTEEQRETRDRNLEFAERQYDESPERQKDAIDKFLGKEEKQDTRQAAGTKPEDRRAAEDAIDKIIEEDSKFDQTNDAFSEDAEGFGTDFITNRQGATDTETSDEAKPPDLSGEDVPSEESVTLASLKTDIDALRKDFDLHSADGDTHYAG